ncbi:MAG: BON domain-containing protein [Pseudomonadota bacterium]|nr:BON domain-containing protein [Pseudomonadota bacterium]
MNRQHHQSQRHQRNRNPDERNQYARGNQAQNFDNDDHGRQSQHFSDDRFAARDADRYPHGYSSARSAPWAEPYRYGYPESGQSRQAESGNREMPYGADQRYASQRSFDEYDLRDWAREPDRSWSRDAMRQDGRSNLPSNPYDGGGDYRSSWLDSGSRNPMSDETRRFGGASEGRDGSRSSTYGRQTPKGYTRSDERIKDDVCEHLYHANDIDLSDVSIESKDGTLVLEGTVPERRMKHRIEDIAEQCIGVSDVDNRIRVSRDGGTQATGTDQRDGTRKSGSSTPASKH